ncbi:MAG: hypothetical protein CMK32_02570 [Porticoccaceae bacterium]|nr:hypothetical protein [Porticoccaceae bacterium]
MDSTKINSYVDSYYKTNKSHVAWSFWASLSALIIGLVALVFGIGLAFFGSSTAISVTTTAAGVFTQFIGAGFFYLYNKNLKQLNVFYQELVKNQDMLFAFSLVGHIPESERPRVIEALIGKLLSRGDGPTNLTPELVQAIAALNNDKNKP